MYILPLILFMITVVVILLALYVLPQVLAKRNIIFTTISEGKIGAVSSIEASAAPDMYFSSEFDDGERISKKGIIFDPSKGSISDYLVEFLEMKGVFYMGLPGYAIRSKFPDIKLKKVISTRSGKDTTYSLSDYSPCSNNGTEFPRFFTIGIIVDNIEIPDGSQVDIIMTITLKIYSMQRILAMTSDDQFAQLSQERVGGQVNDYLKRRKSNGDFVFAKYSDVQTWAANENTSSKDDLFERLYKLNEKLPGRDAGEGFKELLGATIVAASVNGIQGEDSIAKAALGVAIKIEDAKGNLIEAQNQAEITEIRAKAEAMAIKLKGDAEAEARLAKIKALASEGTEVATQQALSELSNLTTYVAAGGKDLHTSIDINNNDSKNKKEAK